MTTTRRSIGARRIPLHDHSDLNSGGKLRVSSAIQGGVDTITGLIPPSAETPAEGAFETTTGGGNPTSADLGNLGSTETIDAANGNHQRGTLDEDCAITVAPFNDGSIVLKLTNTTFAVTWSGVTFGDDADDQPDESADTFFTFVSDDGTVYGFKAGGSGGSRKWEVVTDGEDVLVWEDDDLVYEWSD